MEQNGKKRGNRERRFWMVSRVGIPEFPQSGWKGYIQRFVTQGVMKRNEKSRRKEREEEKRKKKERRNGRKMKRS